MITRDPSALDSLIEAERITRRQRRHLRGRPDSEYEDVCHLAACSFLPNPGAIAFDSPIQPLRAVMAAVLSYARRVTSRGNVRWFPFLRTVLPSVDFSEGIVVWNEGRCGWGFDLAVTLQTKAMGPNLTVEQLSLARLGLDMDRAIGLTQFERVVRHVSLPPVLVALPRQLTIRPEPTEYVLECAARMELPWRMAWSKLFGHAPVPACLNRSGQQLIDLRLVEPEVARQSLGEYVDLRAFLGRDFSNPWHPIEEHLARYSTEELITRLQNMLPPSILEATDPNDLLAACTIRHRYNNRRAPVDIQPLRLSKASRIEVWRPQGETNSPEAFTISRTGVCADLWSMALRWTPATSPNLEHAIEQLDLASV